MRRRRSFSIPSTTPAPCSISRRPATLHAHLQSGRDDRQSGPRSVRHPSHRRNRPCARGCLLIRQYVSRRRGSVARAGSRRRHRHAFADQMDRRSWAGHRRRPGRRRQVRLADQLPPSDVERTRRWLITASTFANSYSGRRLSSFRPGAVVRREHAGASAALVSAPPPSPRDRSPGTSSARRAPCSRQISEQVAELALAEDRHQWIDDCADAEGRERHDCELPPVRQLNGNDVAAVDPEPPQRGGGAGDQVAEFGVVETAPCLRVLEHERHLCRLRQQSGNESGRVDGEGVRLTASGVPERFTGKYTPASYGASARASRKSANPAVTSV